MSDFYNKGDKFLVKVLQEKEVFYLDCDIGVRYYEDTKLNGREDDEHNPKIPCYDKEDNAWKPLINLHSGQIQNWIKGNYADVHYKVCDAGTYKLLDENYNIVASIDNGYVPKIMCVGENGFGDYVIMHIDENGFIKDFKVQLEEFCHDYRN
jgi:hypothetical protein